MNGEKHISGHLFANNKMVDVSSSVFFATVTTAVFLNRNKTFFVNIFG